MEAVLRTAYETKLGKCLPKVGLFSECRGLAGVKKAVVHIGEVELSLCIAHGGKNIQQVLSWIEKGQEKFHAVEMMTCPGGCIGGGGQAISNDPDVARRRSQALYRLDEHSLIRRSHENPAVQALYKELLLRPLSQISIPLLHTTYEAKAKNAPGKGRALVRGYTATQLQTTTRGSDVLILFASQGGKTAARAKDMAKMGQKLRIPCRCIACDAYDISGLGEEKFVIVMTSSFGDGEFPDNGKEFFRHLVENEPDLSRVQCTLSC